MSPAISQNERAGSAQKGPTTPTGRTSQKATCPCCHEPYLKRIVVLECSSCGYRKVESETDVES